MKIESSLFFKINCFTILYYRKSYFARTNVASKKSSENRLSHNHGHNKAENARSKSEYQWAGLKSCTCSEAAPLLIKDPRSASDLVRGYHNS